jgi:peptidoglycan/LPS O-acetylase OafA/YrhL
MKRLLYIDNLRIFLIVLVVLHHLLITYGAPGGWYYKESLVEGVAMLPYAMFVATNQSFFMAMFFMISAFFMVPSFDRKGTKKFIIDRLIRLGIPLLIFYFFLNPLTIYILVRLRDGAEEGLLYYLSNPGYFGFGPMWFVEALLLFTLVYVAVQSLSKAQPGTTIKIPFPGTTRILLLAVFLGILTYLVRIYLPVGWSLDPFNFQLPHFIQYIALFCIGIYAYRNNWFDQITSRQGIKWFLAAQLLIFVAFPVLFAVGGAAENGADAFMGGLTWQSFAYAVWEQVTGFALTIGLTGLFKQKLNKQNTLTKNLSVDAYTVYIIHAPLLVLLTLLYADFQADPWLKFLILVPISLVVIFIVADVVRRLPLARKIL